MGKKKNRKLEAVLHIDGALGGKFKQSLIEQVLKDCAGDVETCIFYLSSIDEANEVPTTIAPTVMSGKSEESIAVALSVLHDHLSGVDFDDEVAKGILLTENLNIEASLARLLEFLTGQECHAAAERPSCDRRSLMELDQSVFQLPRDFTPCEESPALPKETPVAAQSPRDIFSSMFSDLLDAADIEAIWSEAVNRTAHTKLISDSSSSSEDLINLAINAAIDQVQLVEQTETETLCGELEDDDDDDVLTLSDLNETDFDFDFDFTLPVDVSDTEAAPSSSNFEKYSPQSSSMSRNVQGNKSAKDVATDVVKSFMACSVSDRAIASALQRFGYDPEAAIDYLSSDKNKKPSNRAGALYGDINTNTPRRENKVPGTPYSYASRVKHGVTSYTSSPSPGGFPLYDDNYINNNNIAGTGGTIRGNSSSANRLSELSSHNLVANTNTNGNKSPTKTSPGKETEGEQSNRQEQEREGEWQTVNRRPAGNNGDKSRSSLLQQEHHWRVEAQQEGRKMMETYRKAAALHSKQQGALAGHVSSTGQNCKHRMLVYGAMAAKCALAARNPHILVEASSSGRLEYRGLTSDPIATNTVPNSVVQFAVDLHGLYVKEALEFVQSLIDHYSFSASVQRALIRLIVGRGNHSIGGVSRLGPSIKKFLDSQGVPNSLVGGELRLRIES